MRIINLEAFLSMPSGTVFAKYRPQIFGELCIKGASLTSDFYYTPLWDVDANGSGEAVDTLWAAQNDGREVRIDFECEQRDGFFEESQLFAVFHRDEVERLARSLMEAAGKA